MKVEKLAVEMVFVEPLLGSGSGNKELMEDFIISRAPTAEAQAEETAEMENLPETISKASTVFSRDQNGLHLWNYQVRGFLKEGVHALIELGEITGLSKWAYKKAVDSFVIVQPRRIYLLNEKGQVYTKAVDNLQRSLRAETMRGERIALARSELLPEGTRIRFGIELLVPSLPSKSKLAVLRMDDIKAVLDYAKYKGLGQWRSGGFGTATWKEIPGL